MPDNLSLAAQVYFSQETLTKIKKAVNRRPAVIVGNRFSHSHYETLLSDCLDVPLLNGPSPSPQEERLFFKKTQIKTAKYALVPPGVSVDELL